MPDPGARTITPFYVSTHIYLQVIYTRSSLQVPTWVLHRARLQRRLRRRRAAVDRIGLSFARLQRLRARSPHRDRLHPRDGGERIPPAATPPYARAPSSAAPPTCQRAPDTLECSCDVSPYTPLTHLAAATTGVPAGRGPVSGLRCVHTKHPSDRAASYTRRSSVASTYHLPRGHGSTLHTRATSSSLKQSQFHSTRLSLSVGPPLPPFPTYRPTVLDSAPAAPPPPSISTPPHRRHQDGRLDAAHALASL